MTASKPIAAAGLAASLLVGGAQAADAERQVHYRYEQVGDVKVFYREAGNPTAPTVLLLHGFAGSSFMFRDLIPELADRYHVIAPDLPAFGFTEAPARGDYPYTFSQLAKTVGQFTEQLKLQKYTLMVHDYGAPVGWRLAVAHPERVTAIISQNGNAYEEGLGDSWALSRNTGVHRRNRTARRCTTSRHRLRSSGNTLKGLPTRARFRQTPTRWKGCRS